MPEEKVAVFQIFCLCGARVGIFGEDACYYLTEDQHIIFNCGCTKCGKHIHARKSLTELMLECPDKNGAVTH